MFGGRFFSTARRPPGTAQTMRQARRARFIGRPPRERCRALYFRGRRPEMRADSKNRLSLMLRVFFFFVGFAVDVAAGLTSEDFLTGRAEDLHIGLKHGDVRIGAARLIEGSAGFAHQWLFTEAALHDCLPEGAMASGRKCESRISKCETHPNLHSNFEFVSDFEIRISNFLWQRLADSFPANDRNRSRFGDVHEHAGVVVAEDFGAVG